MSMLLKKRYKSVSVVVIAIMVHKDPALFSILARQQGSVYWMRKNFNYCRDA